MHLGWPVAAVVDSVSAMDACPVHASTGVLDIAGGRGDLAQALSSEFGVDTTVIDPVQRPPRHASKRSADGEKSRARRPVATHGCTTEVPGRIRQLLQPFDQSFGQPCPHNPAHESLQPPQEQEQAEWLLANASVLVGLHPDQPTGDIAIVANSRQGPRGPAPFAVVPCCVFSESFPDRTIGVARPRGTDSDVADAGRPVRETHELSVWLAERSLLTYDGAKDTLTSTVPDRQWQVRVGRLPFNGRNQVVYTVPSPLGTGDDYESGGQPHAKRSRIACGHHGILAE